MCIRPTLFEADKKFKVNWFNVIVWGLALALCGVFWYGVYRFVFT